MREREKDYRRWTLGPGQLKAIQCPICGIFLDLLTHVHVESHGMNKKEFLAKYPEFNRYYYWGDAPVCGRKRVFSL